MNAENQFLSLPSQRIRAALRAIPRATDFIDKVLDGTGITPKDCDDPAFEFPLAALEAISVNLSRLVGPGWFLKVPALWSAETQSVLGTAMRSAPDLRTSLDVFAEFFALLWPLGTWRLEASRDGIHLTFARSPNLFSNGWEMLEPISALNFQTSVRTAVGQLADQVVYEFSSAPPPYREALEEILTGSVRWNRMRQQVIVPNHLLDCTSNTADAITFAAVISLLRRQLQLKDEAVNVADQVRQMLAATNFGQISQSEVAQRLRLSGSTLERRLRKQGVTFRELLDESLRDRLLSLIKAPYVTADSLAQRLGYYDTSGLQRACKRLLGKTYGQLRRDWESINKTE